MKTDYVQVLRDNAAATGNSFVYYLHERRQFDEAAFATYYEAIAYFAAQTPDVKYRPAILSLIARTHKQILTCFIYHLDKGDLYVIPNMPINYYAYLEKLDNIIDVYFADAKS